MANFTENEIKKSFLGLLNRKKLADITVKDIVDDCRINRSSFYYHFQDVPNLLKSIMIESTREIVERFPEELTAAECVSALLDLILENKRGALHIYRSASRDMMRDLLTEGIHYGASHYVEYATKSQNVTDEEKRMMIDFSEYFLLGFAIYWLEGGLQEKQAEDLKRILSEQEEGKLPFFHSRKTPEMPDKS